LTQQDGDVVSAGHGEVLQAIAIEIAHHDCAGRVKIEIVAAADTAAPSPSRIEMLDDPPLRRPGLACHRH
jgi:hypothetical protein